MHACVFQALLLGCSVKKCSEE